MRNLLAIERFCLYGHVVAMAFGLAGLLWVVPHPGILEYLPAGPTLFRWSMAGGGVGYILLGTVAVALYAYRTLGLGSVITFAIASVGISLTSELLGTSTGFPFGHYSYLNGLGYKVAGLVPFTIPLSWFYLGLASFLLARSGLAAGGGGRPLQLGAIASRRVSRVYPSYLLGFRARSGHEPNRFTLLVLARARRVFWYALPEFCRLAWHWGRVYGCSPRAVENLQIFA